MELLVTGPRRNRPTRRDRGVPRKRTIAQRFISREAGVGQVDLDEHAVTQRPLTRADCKEGPRPCPWIGCTKHLFLDVNPENGSITFNFPDRDFDELEETCSVDVGERGGITLEEVGIVMNLTRERIRQLEVRALLKLKFETRLGRELGRFEN